MSDLQASLAVNIAGNVEQRSKSMDRSFTGFTKRASRSANALRRSTALLGKGLDRLGNRYTGLLTGAAGVGTAKGLIDLDARITRLGTSASRSKEEMEALKEQVQDVSNQADIRVDSGEILSAIEQIVEKTGDLDFARDNLENIGLAIQAAGAAGSDVGSFFAELQKKGVTGSGEVLETVDALVQQGKQGAFVFKDMAALGSRLFTAYKKSGKDAIIEVGALSQIIRTATGSSEQATAAEALFRTLGNVQKVDLLEKKLGVQVRLRDTDGNIVKGTRDVTDILADILEKSDGDEFVLSKIFDAEALKVFNGLMIEGNAELLQSLRTVTATGAVVRKDSKQNADTAAAAITSLSNGFKKMADRNLTKPIQLMADAINSINPDTLDSLFKVGAGVVAITGAAVIGKKISKTVKSVTGRKSSNPLGGGSFGAPIPVIVVNDMPGFGGAGGGGKGGKGKGGSRRGGRLGKLGKAGKLLGRVALPLALLSSGVALSNTLTDDTASTKEKVVGSSGILGGAAGGVAGAKLGAAIGTFIAPGIGTAIGAAIGGLGGFLAGELAASSAASALTPDAIGKAVGKHINDKELKVTLEAQGLKTKSVESAQGVNLNLSTGVMMQ